MEVTSEEYNPYSDIPKEVRIGYLTVRIKVNAAHELVNEFGHANNAAQLIRVAPNQTNQGLANTFLHEVIHLIHWVYGLWGGTEPDEEDYTNQTTNGLCQFIQDNPEAWAWFMKNNVKERGVM